MNVRFGYQKRFDQQAEAGLNDPVMNRKIRIPAAIFGIALCAWSQTLAQSAVEKEGIWISGDYDYIFSNGAPPKTSTYHFVAVTASDGWSISITNSNNPKEWGLMQSDGVDIFTIGTDTLNNYKVFGYAYPGPIYIPAAPQNSVKFFFPWTVFHLSPRMILEKEKKGMEMVGPWSSRISLTSFGSKWETTYGEEGRIIKSLKVIRDSSLDLKTVDDELRRPGLVFPFEFGTRERRLEQLKRRKEFPDGFVKAVYECDKVFKTNGIIVPSAARFAAYWPDWKNLQSPGRLLFELHLRLGTVRILSGEQIPELVAASETRVWDYRYEVANKRTKFNRAEYMLQPGEPFPTSRDPKLLAQAEKWLKHGPGYDHLQSRRRGIWAAMAAITSIGIGLLIFLAIRKHKNKYITTGR